MEYRTLGKTGDRISTIGMGTWRIGATSDPEERAKQVQAIRRGIELGINLIDTAEVYHRGGAEQVVAEAIKGQRESVFIATKVSSDHLRREDVIEACEGSLRRLGIDQIDLYQVHWPNPRVPIAETMAAMEQLVREGKVRYIGVSNFSPRQTQDARESLSRSEVVSNQVEYSLSNRAAEAELLPYCAREGLTLIAYSPLARGIIPESGISQALLEKYRMTPAQVMLNWATRDEAVVAIPKAARVEHVEENAASVSVRFSRSEYESVGVGVG